jgi:hypothetical protein
MSIKSGRIEVSQRLQLLKEILSGLKLSKK